MDADLRETAPVPRGADDGPREDHREPTQRDIARRKGGVASAPGGASTRSTATDSSDVGGKANALRELSARERALEERARPGDRAGEALLKDLQLEKSSSATADLDVRCLASGGASDVLVRLTLGLVVVVVRGRLFLGLLDLRRVDRDAGAPSPRSRCPRTRGPRGRSACRDPRPPRSAAAAASTPSSAPGQGRPSWRACASASRTPATGAGRRRTSDSSDPASAGRRTSPGTSSRSTSGRASSCGQHPCVPSRSFRAGGITRGPGRARRRKSPVPCLWLP